MGKRFKMWFPHKRKEWGVVLIGLGLFLMLLGVPLAPQSVFGGSLEAGPIKASATIGGISPRAAASIGVGFIFLVLGSILQFGKEK